VALKRVAEQSGPVIKRITPDQAPKGEFADKEQLVGRLAIVTLKEFDDAYVGNFGRTEKAVVDILDVEDGTPQEHKDFWCYGLLARQIAKYLDPGESGLGRVESGPSKTGGNPWYGFGFSDSDDDLKRAHEALSLPPF
jgi:hypothetical protein